MRAEAGSHKALAVAGANDSGLRGRQVLPAIMATRLLSDTANQMFNPFLGIFAAGLGVSLQQLGVLLSLRSLAGLSGPLLGAVADRRGALPVARFGLLLLAGGLVILGLSSSWLGALAAIVPMGVALGIINPALQSYLGGAVRFERRSRALSVAEYSWALAGMIGLLVVGWVIGLASWRVAVFGLAGLLALSQLWLARLPAPPVLKAPGVRAANRLTTLAWVGSAVVGLLFFTMFAAMVVHGVWLSDEFALGAGGLGAAAVALGAADLVGAALVSLLGGRVKVELLVGFACAACTVAYAWLAAWPPAGLIAAVWLLAAARLTMQTGFVGMLTLLSEVAPGARGLTMATAAAVGQVGMGIAAVAGPAFYAAYSYAGVAIVSAAGMVIATLLVVAFARGYSLRALNAG